MDFFAGFVLASLIWFALWIFLRKRPLKPLVCVCGHGNNIHAHGTGYCHFYSDDKRCDCEIFIANRPDYAVKDLERMVGL